MHGGSRDKAVGNAFKAYYDTGLRKKLPVWSDSEPQEAELEEAVA
jgi:hypothetical protein